MAAVAVAAAAGGVGAASPGATSSASGAGPLAGLGLPDALSPVPLLSAESIGLDTGAGSATATRAATTRVTVPTTAAVASAVGTAVSAAKVSATKTPAAQANARPADAATPPAPTPGPLASVVGALPELDAVVPGVVIAAVDDVLPAATPATAEPATAEPAPAPVAGPATAGPETAGPETAEPSTVAPAAGQALEAATAEAVVDGSDLIAAEIVAARARARELLAQRLEEIGAAAKQAAASQISAALASPRSCAFNASIQKQPKLSAAQLRNVRAIVDVAKEMNLPPRAAVIALATAHQESWLKNLDWGDRDSLGLFQQRPSMGWGSRSQVTDPRYAAEKFYRVLLEVDGWEHLPVTVAAQRVQRSAFASRYAQWELMAARLVAQSLDAPLTALDCSPR